MFEVEGIALAAACASIGSVITRRAAAVEAAAESCKAENRKKDRRDQGEDAFGEDICFAPGFGSGNQRGESTRFYAEAHRSETSSVRTLEGLPFLDATRPRVCSQWRLRSGWHRES